MPRRDDPLSLEQALREAAQARARDEQESDRRREKRIVDLGRENRQLQDQINNLKEWKKENSSLNEVLKARQEKLNENVRRMDELNNQLNRTRDSTVALTQRIRELTETTTHHSDQLFELIRANNEWKLSMQASANALTLVGRASADQLRTLTQIRDNLRLTREEFSKFQNTLREGVELGIDPRQLDEITKKLQALYGHEGGLAKAGLVVQAEQQAPGAITAARGGSDQQFRQSIAGLPHQLRDALRDFRMASQGATGGPDASMSNSLAQSRKILDDIRITLTNQAEKYLGPLTVIQAPAIVGGLSILARAGFITHGYLRTIINELSAIRSGSVGGGVGGAGARGKRGLGGKLAGGVALAGFATDIGASYFEEGARAQGNEAGAAKLGGLGALGSVAGSAATGAAIGSFGGPVGAVAGGVVGAGVGLFAERERIEAAVKAFSDSTQESITYQEAARSSTKQLSEALNTSIGSVEAFDAALQNAVNRANRGEAQFQARVAEQRQIGVVSAGGSPDQLATLAREREAGVAARIRSLETATATAGGRQAATPEDRFRQDQQQQQRVRAEAETERKRLDEEIRAADKRVMELTRAGGIRMYGGGKTGPTPETKFGINAANQLELNPRDVDSPELIEARARSRGLHDRRSNINQGVAAADQAGETSKQQEKLYREQRERLENELLEVRSVVALQQQINQAMDNLLGPRRMEAKLQQQMLGVLGDIAGDNHRILDSTRARTAYAEQEADESEKALKALKSQYEGNVASIMEQRTKGVYSEERAREALQREEIRYGTAARQMQERVQNALQERMSALKEGIQALVQAPQQLSQYRIAAEQGTLGRARFEAAQTAGQTPGQARQQLQEIATQSATIFDTIQRTIGQRMENINKIAQEAQGSVNQRVGSGAITDQQAAEERREIETKRVTGVIQAQTEMERARTTALQDSFRAISESARLERNRVETQISILEQQKGLAEFTGASYQTQLSIQKDIVKAKAQELSITRNEMAQLVQMGGDAVKNTEGYQNLQRKEAQQAADVFKQSMGVQKDFLDKALGRMFGVSGSTGSRFQPGVGNQDYMTRSIFGEHTRVGGINVRGQVSPEQQRRALQGGALEGLAGRPVGRANIALANGMPAPVLGPAPNAIPAPGNAPVPANPVQPAVQAPAANISGRIDLVVRMDQTGNLAAFVERKVIEMADQGAIVRGRRGAAG